MINFLLCFFILIFLSNQSFGSINYHGRIISQSNNQPLTSSNVRFNIKIKSGSSCTLYEENHDNINMTSSNGYFNLNVGEGSVVFGSFDNSMKTDGSSVSCSEGGTNNLSFTTAKSINVQILDYDGSNYTINVAQINGLQIKESPVAISAKNLQGKILSDFILNSGNVSQTNLELLASGSSTLYIQSSNFSTELSPYLNLKLDKNSNLSDLQNAATARTNLGLGSLATLNSVSDTNITSLAYSKLTGVPTSFTPSAHYHVISDVTGLQTALNGKISSTQLSLNCTAAQTIQYVSVTDSYQCQSIAISNTQVSGLGTASTQNVGTAANNIVQLDTNAKLPTSTLPTSVLTTSSTFAGDVTGTSGNLTVTNIQNIPVSATAPTAGQVLVYNGTQWVPTRGLPVYTRKTADQTYSTTTLTNDSLLSFAVTNGSSYKFKFMILYTSAATTTGLRVGLTFPTVTIGSAFATVSLGADGTGAYYSGVINSSGDSVLATGTPTTAPNVNIAFIEGIITPSANGTVQLQAATEVAGSNIIIRAGSLVEYTLLP